MVYSLKMYSKAGAKGRCLENQPLAARVQGPPEGAKPESFPTVDIEFLFPNTPKIIGSLKRKMQMPMPIPA